MARSPSWPLRIRTAATSSTDDLTAPALGAGVISSVIRCLSALCAGADQVDDTDRNVIVNCESTDRTSFADIATAVALGESIVRSRFARLTRCAIVQFVRLSNTLQLGEIVARVDVTVYGCIGCVYVPDQIDRLDSC